MIHTQSEYDIGGNNQCVLREEKYLLHFKEHVKTYLHIF